MLTNGIFRAEGMDTFSNCMPQLYLGRGITAGPTRTVSYLNPDGARDTLRPKVNSSKCTGKDY